MRTRAPSPKLIAVILPFTSACSSTLSAASSVPVDVTISASGAGSTTSVVTFTGAAPRARAAGAALAVPVGFAKFALEKIFGAASTARTPTTSRIRTITRLGLPGRRSTA